jgi:hypothetical protein
MHRREQWHTHEAANESLIGKMRRLVCICRGEPFFKISPRRGLFC